MGGGPEYATNGTKIGEDSLISPIWNVACDVNETGWVKTTQAIISVDCQSGTHTPPSASLQLRWRNLTDSPGGIFNTLVTGSGELRAGTSAGGITNTDPVGFPQNCPADIIDASEEVENESPLQSASLSASQNDQIETQWCVDMSNALDGKEYEFELYNTTEAESCGICIPTITIEIPAQCLPQTDSRIADDSASWQGACDADIADWVKTNEFILATWATGGDDGSKNFKLQWKESGGSFADVGADTEIKYGTGTVLVDGNNVATTSACLSSTKSEENEGDNSATLDTMGASDVGEIQWALGFGSGAQDGITYEFQLVNVTDTQQEICSCSITTFIAGGYAEGIERGILRGITTGII